MGKTLIFAGPTLYGASFRPLKNEVLLPPAGQGDLLRNTLYHCPEKIVLIDGTFFHTLSVWHKEILFALADGVVVIGSSSMGALRAAELDRYGMIGVGKIYEAYRSCTVQDDAWVAMSYDPETYRPLVEAPCGQKQKLADALEAIELSRGFILPKRIVTKADLRPILAGVLDKILETESLIYG